MTEQPELLKASVTEIDKYEFEPIIRLSDALLERESVLLLRRSIIRRS